MPAKGHSTAPTWDADPATLAEFFEEVKDLADTQKVTDDEIIIKAAGRYAPKAESSIWKATAAFTGKNWLTFVKAILDLYPGAEAEQLHTLADLDAFVAKRAATPIATSAELGLYFRDFLKISAYLVNNTRISTGERDRYFLKGFELNLRRRVVQRYNIATPAHHPHSDYDYIKVRAACDFVLAENLADFPLTIGSVAPASSTTTALPVAIKAEPDIAGILFQMQQQIASLQQQPASAPPAAPQRTAWPPRQPWAAAMAAPVPASGANATPLSGASGYGDRPPLVCMFCGKAGELMRYCPIANAYMEAGKAVRDPERGNRLVLPNNAPLPYVPNGTLKDRFDAFYAANPAAQPAARSPQTNLISVSRTPVPATEIDEVDLMAIIQSVNHITCADGEDPTVAILEAAVAKAKKKTRFEDDEPRPRPTTFRPANLPAKGQSSPAVPPANPAPATPSTAPPPHPQYQFRAPIEDTDLVKNVIDRVLDTSISVTQRELFTLSSDVRKYYKDATTTRKVPIATPTADAPIRRAFIEEVVDDDEDYDDRPFLSANLREKSTCSLTNAAPSHDGKVPLYQCEVSGCKLLHPYPTAPLSVDVRAITPVFNGTHQVESLLDSGSEVTCMRRNIWEKLGVPVSEELRLNLESAD